MLVENIRPKEQQEITPVASKNKSWNRKAKEQKHQTKKQLAIIVQQLVQDRVWKELATMSKKWKELLAMEIKQEDSDSMDLQEFNYNDLKCSPIQDEDSVSGSLSLPSISTSFVW